MPNPNPSPATRFKSEREEPLTKRFTIRVAPSTLEKLKAKENWREFVRQAIDKALAEVEEEEENIKSA
ncbi:MAG: hypothetical protein QNJ54_01595 [Prochloraceae cyanobacterium]|nr:hypothetical protein [Prochloraceae cyanobacterium]